MASFLFVFGRTPELSFLELKSLLPETFRISSQISLVESLSVDPQDFLVRLGGTVKIVRLLGRISDLSLDRLLRFFPQEESKFSFGISAYAGARLPSNLERLIKERLALRGQAVSFRKTKSGQPLGSVVVAKQHLFELIIVKQNLDYLIGQTVAVQPFEEWNKRDYGRPFADPVAGMLPPKVARMIVNAAYPVGVLLDPFCGMGTILAEALLTGWQVIGSDQDPEAVRKAKANLVWLKSEQVQLQAKRIELLVSDATHVSDQLKPNSIDAIVTEPFMGDSNIKYQTSKIKNKNIKNKIRGLEKLYLGCLKDWHKVLKSSGKVIMALPRYEINSKKYFVKRVIDNCEKLGYTRQAGPIEYSRPQAIVKREFYIFNYGTR